MSAPDFASVLQRNQSAIINANELVAQLNAAVAEWLSAHETSVAITDAMTQRGAYMIRARVREVLGEAAALSALAATVEP